VDVIATLIELKPRSSDAVDEWSAYIEAHRAEAEETLRSEGVEVESWFALSLSGRDYLLCYMRADDVDAAHKAMARSTNPVDAYHQQFKRRTCVSRISGRLLVDLRSGGNGCEG
jgi:hypothetical protein